MYSECVMKCPSCEGSKKEEMPLGYKETEYSCAFCGFLMKAEKEDCCVYCVYSNMICPSQQEKRDCCPGDDPDACG